jgi:hypothetical protein
MTFDVEDVVRRRLLAAAASTPDTQELIVRIEDATIGSGPAVRRWGRRSGTLVSVAAAVAVVCVLGALSLDRHNPPLAVNGATAQGAVGLPLSSVTARPKTATPTTATYLNETSATTLQQRTALPTSPTPHPTGTMQAGGWRLLGSNGRNIDLFVTVGGTCDSLNYLRVVESDSTVTITAVILHDQPAGTLCGASLSGRKGFITLAAPIGHRRLIKGHL